MPPEGHQKAFWWPPKLDYHARGVAKRQTPPGGTGGHQKPPEGHLKVTLRPPEAPRGPQRPPGAMSDFFDGPVMARQDDWDPYNRCISRSIPSIQLMQISDPSLGVQLSTHNRCIDTKWSNSCMTSRCSDLSSKSLPTFAAKISLQVRHGLAMSSTPSLAVPVSNTQTASMSPINSRTESIAYTSCKDIVAVRQIGTYNARAEVLE